MQHRTHYLGRACTYRNYGVTVRLMVAVFAVPEAVAVTTTAEVPAGVVEEVPPQPTITPPMAATDRMASSNRPRALRLLRDPNRTQKSNASTTVKPPLNSVGDVLRCCSSSGRLLRAPESVFVFVVMVSVVVATVVPEVVTVEGAKLQVVNAGSPLQANVVAPTNPVAA